MWRAEFTPQLHRGLLEMFHELLEGVDISPIDILIEPHDQSVPNANSKPYLYVEPFTRLPVRVIPEHVRPYLVRLKKEVLDDERVDDERLGNEVQPCGNRGLALGTRHVGIPSASTFTVWMMSSAMRDSTPAILSSLQ